MTGCSTRLDKNLFSSSLLSDYLCCPHAAYLKYVLKLRPKEDRASTTFGVVWHDVLAEWYRSGDVQKAEAQVEKLPEFSSPYTRERMLLYFEQYRKRYPTEDWKVLDVESTFSLDMEDGSFWAGRLDLVVEWAGGVYVVDHKTSSRMGPGFGEKYQLSLQITGYCYACEQLLGKCNGAIINGLNTSDNPGERFRRFHSPRLPFNLQEWEHNYHLVINDLRRDLEEGVYKKNYSFCGVYGCDYAALCSNGMEENLLQGLYKVVEEGGEEDE